MATVFFALRTNATNRVAIGENLVFTTPSGFTEITTGGDISLTCGFGSNYFLHNIKEKSGNGNWKNIALDLTSGKLVWENSTRRYKRNIRPLVDDFSLILKSQPRIYNRLDDTIYHELGYIAEEMDSIGLHKLVQRNAEGVIDGFDYTKMILYAVEVLKIQDATIRDLKSEIAALKTENEGIRTKNDTLHTENNTLQSQQSALGIQLQQLSKRINSLESSLGEKNRK